MDRLSDYIFNYIRSYLTFQEIHNTSSVSKHWNDIQKVRKFIRWNGLCSRVWPLHACFSNIIILQHHHSPANLEIMLHNSKTTLQEFVIFRLYNLSGYVIHHIPELSALTKLLLHDYEAVGFNQRIMTKCPNLKVLCYWTEDGSSNTIDLSWFPNLEEIQLMKDEEVEQVPTLLNLEKHIDLTYITNYLHVGELSSLLPLKNDITIIILSSSLNEIRFARKEDYAITFSTHEILIRRDGHHLKNFKDMLEEIKRYHNPRISISSGTQMADGLGRILQKLCDSEIFTRQQIKDML